MTDNHIAPILHDPLIHSSITDILPEAHPLAYQQVYCPRCSALLHAVNNESMRDWIETGKGNFCIPCWVAMLVESGEWVDECVCMENDWGLAHVYPQ